jgi:O-antigen biosynthesis protein
MVHRTRPRLPNEDMAEETQIVDALQWSLGQIVDLLPPEEPPQKAELPWTFDAGGDPVAYRIWLSQNHDHTPIDLDSLSGGPLISVVIPVYRPELWYFKACVSSIIDQAYTNWELCMCDDGSQDADLTRTMRQLVDSDSRIKFVALERNGGISRATNTALSIASGEFVALVDHDDALEPDALALVAAAIMRDPQADVVYSDDDKIDGEGARYDPYFKPDWAPDLLLSSPYLGHLTVIRRSLLDAVGGFRPEFDGSQDFDVMLRTTERARRVVHIPKVLYHWRAVEGSAAADENAKPWAHRASRRVVEDTVVRRGIDGTVQPTVFPGVYHIRRNVKGDPSVAIVIPFRDQARLTAQCLASIEKSPGYDNYDVVLIDNGSTEPETQALRRRIEARGVRVLDYPEAFNWATLNNMAAANTDADLLLLMNNDVEAKSEGWLHALVELAQLPEVGVVGARLIFPDGVLQHAGVLLGARGIAEHIFSGMPPGSAGYFLWDRVVRPYSAVTGACLMTRHSVFDELGGFDEALAVAFNDVDYCMRASDAGYRVLYTPHAELVHHESTSRGTSGFGRDVKHFVSKWDRSRIRSDPFYNPNLGRFDMWCPLAGLDEMDRWERLMDDMKGI